MNLFKWVNDRKMRRRSIRARKLNIELSGLIEKYKTYKCFFDPSAEIPYLYVEMLSEMQRRVAEIKQELKEMGY